MGQALYRKYRSKSLDTVVGQEHITSTLAHALKTGKLAHAYLFTGPRGVGKTSIARILAHEINGLPYTDDSMHLDIIEIDAASNRRIDEIRDLRDKVNIAPTSAKYKVYIIDEVHMLTREAFNALLKTLEEPPAHVVFILATTESHKLPETIISRTQRFMFKPVDLEKVTAHLRSIADSEKIDIADDALHLIAAHGEGSFRDSISLLDQCRGYDGAVSADQVRSLIGLPPDEAIDHLRQALDDHDSARLVTSLAGLRDQGFAAPQVAKRLGQRLRADIIAGNGNAAEASFQLLQQLLDTPAAHDPETHLELSLLRYALTGTTQASARPTKVAAASTTAAATVTQRPTATAKHTAPAMSSEILAGPPPSQQAEPSSTTATASVAEPPAATATDAQSPPAAPASGPAQPLDATTWPLVLNEMKRTHNTLYGIVRMARADFKADRVDLYFRFAFHQKRVNEPKNRDVILNAIQVITGRHSNVKCLVEDSAGQVAKTPSPTTPGPVATPPAATDLPAPTTVTDPAVLATINNIFGGGEVLNS